MNNVTLTRESRRGIPMVEIEVDSVTTQCLPNGNLVRPGISRVQIYEDELPQVEALTRTAEENERLERAVEEYNARFEQYVEEECAGDRKKAEERCPLSVESVFLLLNKSLKLPHVKPLRSLKVIQKDIPPPEKKEAWDASERTAQMFASVISSALSNDGFLLSIAEKVADILGSNNSGPKRKS